MNTRARVAANLPYRSRHFHAQLHAAHKRWGKISPSAVSALRELLENLPLSITSGDILFLEGRWYVTHAGLLRVAAHNRCSGIGVQPIAEFCDRLTNRWAFKATVYKSPNCRGFVGFGDADPSNVSPVVRGAEMRVAETRAVNRALRKAYGIGICSVEEIGAFAGPIEPSANVRKLPPQPANGNGGPKLRDQLCLLIRQHRLDASLVKLYAAEFCGTENLRQASREHVESFIKHLAESAANDRDGLLCKLNSYAQKPQKGAA
jgi:hypothetical protein